MSVVCAGVGAPASVTCQPTAACVSFELGPGGSVSVVGDPCGRSEPENASRNATMFAVSWSLVTTPSTPIW